MAKTKTSASPKKTPAKRSPRTRARAPTKAAPRALPTISPVARRGVRYLISAALSGFGLLALASYTVTDPSFFHRSSTSEVANWCGRWGAMLADLLYQGIGLSAWSIALAQVWLLMRFLRKPSATYGKLGVGALGVWWFSSFLGLLTVGEDAGWFPKGGWLGEVTAGWLLDHVGTVGSYVLVLALLLAAATLAFGINWEAIAGKGVKAVEGQAPVVRQGAAGAAQLASDGLVRAREWVAAAFARPEPSVERWEEGPEPPKMRMPRSSEERGERSVHEGAPASVVGARPPGLEPLQIPIGGRLGPPGRPEPVVTVEGGLTGVRFDANAPMDAAVPTQVASREVVEVEYEPTGIGNTPLTPARIADLEDDFEAARPSAVPKRVRGPRTQAREQGIAPSIYDIPRADAAPRSVSTPGRVSTPRPTPAPYVGERAMGDGSVYKEPVDRPAPSAAQDLPEPRFLTPEPAAPPIVEVLEEDYEEVILPEPPSVEELPEAAAEPKRAAQRRTPRTKETAAGRPATGAPELGPKIEVGNLMSGGDDDGGVVIQHADETEIIYELPPLSILDQHDRSVGVLDEEALKEQARALTEKLADFNIKGEVVAIRPGPVITIFEYLPAPGIKVSRIAGLSDDIAMAMRALRVRIVAPIPGKGVVGIEIPNKSRQTVWYRDMLASKEFRDKDWLLPMALGKTPAGKPYFGDLAKMPHLLVGGTTGSGKSVGVNAMLVTMLYHRTPETLRMILIDPKMLEFELYNDIPHLLHPVVTEPKLANAALKWACTEMDERYRVLARWGTRNIENYNNKVERETQDWTPKKARRYAPRGLPKDETPPEPKKLPYIVIVIDELADLMMIASKEVEESIVRLAQKARACGIHLIVATQRPSVDVITGLIKANMPTRIAFQVRSKTDGRTILDQNGAETLLGKGDMLLLPPGVSALQRLHAPFVSDEEAGRVTDFWKAQAEPSYDAQIRVAEDEGPGAIGDDDYDDCYDLAVQIVSEAGKASTSMIQRRLKIGYNRAARIMDMMERDGVVGPADGARPRKVLVDPIDA
ncbi:MAG: DNA segregation ATPase FtsK/SpoIIIE-like protein [Cognaticolwellia sp.]